MALYIVRLLKPVKAGTEGVYDMIGAPLGVDAPPGRRVRMEQDDAIKAARAGHVAMLSPDGLRVLREAPTPEKATYKTRQQKADVDAA